MNGKYTYLNNLTSYISYLSITDDMRYINVSIHTALYELHVVFCQSPCLVCKHILHLEIEQDRFYHRIMGVCLSHNLHVI